MEGVNDELMPLVRMTVPRRARGLSLADVPLGVHEFTSYLLAGGVVPFDAHFLRLDEVGDRRFLERSSSLLQRLWQHERTVEPDGTGCRVTDTVTFEPRLPGAARLVRPIVARIFRHRHRRLRARFGGQPV
jgi:hypothetical protein